MPSSTTPSSRTATGLRIRTGAHLLQAAVLAGAACLVGDMVATWIVPSYALSQVQREAMVDPSAAFGPGLRVACALWALPPTLAVLLALWRLWTLCREYVQGRVFEPGALEALRGFARWMLASAVLSPVHAAGLSVLVTWQRGVGQRELHLLVSSGDYVMLLFGAVVLVIAGVMAEAARLQDENAGFV